MSAELKELIADVKEQVRYLREIGVDSLVAELPEIVVAEGAVETGTPRTKQAVTSVSPPRPGTSPPVPISIPTMEPPDRKKPSAGTRLAKLPSLTKRPVSPKLTTDNLPPRDTSNMSSEPAPATDSALFGDIGGLPESAETMEQIWDDIGNCTRCPLHQGRTQIVHTVGNYNSDLMFVGEAPGADEDAKGEPFVGRAGQLLNKIIEAIGMKREDVCIGNINRCRPPGNRQPTLPEAHTCKPFLLREIAVIRPKVIVVLGNTALHNLLDTKVGITRMRGQFHDYFGVKVMPTFHPAYLLRDPSKKREVWDDMKKVRDYLNSLTK
ncbi:MAG TPA: uracil-DNA glycosylase family protein [Pyrinomonadaceae bacterium]